MVTGQQIILSVLTFHRLIQTLYAWKDPVSTQRMEMLGHIMLNKTVWPGTWQKTRRAWRSPSEPDQRTLHKWIIEAIKNPLGHNKWELLTHFFLTRISSSAVKNNDNPSLSDADVTHLPSTGHFKGKTSLRFERNPPNELIHLHSYWELDRIALLPEKFTQLKHWLEKGGNLPIQKVESMSHSLSLVVQRRFAAKSMMSTDHQSFQPVPSHPLYTHPR